MGKVGHKHLVYEKRGDSLEVKVRDESMTTYYTKTVNKKDTKGMIALVSDLEDFGFDMVQVKKDPKWFE